MEFGPEDGVHPSAEDLHWENKGCVRGNKADPGYSALTEQARLVIPLSKQCLLFCGGRKCKYERPDCWREEETVIRGLFSHWVTENILAMARPNTEFIGKFDIINQFIKLGIRTVFNLQQPHEHAHCGPGLEPSGFTYNPQQLMDNEVFFYNFGWDDYMHVSNNKILDIVRVMQFALSQGKVAVHCHAGLGRTGLLIACYLVFTNRTNADDAIRYVREKRPNSIQTRGQLQCVQNFEQYLKPLWVIYPSKAIDNYEFSLPQFLSRQRKLLHGFEGRHLKYIPKLIYIVCERLLQLAGRNKEHTAGNSVEEMPVMSYQVLNDLSQNNLDVPERPTSLNSPQNNMVSSTKLIQDKDSIEFLKIFPEDCTSTMVEEPVIAVAEALAYPDIDDSVLKKRDEYEVELNSSDEAWNNLAQEREPLVLTALLWDWLDQLKEPLLRYQDLNSILEEDNPNLGLKRLEKGQYGTTWAIVRFLQRLHPLPSGVSISLMERLLSHLTHHLVTRDVTLPQAWRSRHWLDLSPKTAIQLLKFFNKLLNNDSINVPNVDL